MTDDEMAGWHHRLDRHELEQTLGDREGQGSLVCCSLWGHKELDTMERLTELNSLTVSAHLYLLNACGAPRGPQGDSVAAGGPVTWSLSRASQRLRPGSLAHVPTCLPESLQVQHAPPAPRSFPLNVRHPPQVCPGRTAARTGGSRSARPVGERDGAAKLTHRV